MRESDVNLKIESPVLSPEENLKNSIGKSSEAKERERDE